uniref:Secreted protein n=1 Tax=Lygus hesperus TaxID=30085 RepID=A0A146L3L9_LYGHE
MCTFLRLCTCGLAGLVSACVAMIHFSLVLLDGRHDGFVFQYPVMATMPHSTSYSTLCQVEQLCNTLINRITLAFFGKRINRGRYLGLRKQSTSVLGVALKHFSNFASYIHCTQLGCYGKPKVTTTAAVVVCMTVIFTASSTMVV